MSWELTNFSNDIEIIESLSDPEEAIAYLNLNTPDCLFLDIQMPTMDGFQFLGKLTNTDFAIVITTAYDEYAIKALKHEAIDYLLKPVDSDDLQDPIQKIKKYNSRVSNSSKFEEVLVSFNDKYDKKKITINTDGKLIFLDIDAILPEHCFFRIHNSYIINLNKIKEFIKSEGYVVMESNYKIPVARQRKSDFLEKL
ncbi:MAG: two-component system LytT family response regulator [Glaciecola sp.]